MSPGGAPLKRLAEGGMLLALALALAQVKLFQLPSGGSVSLGVFPILLLAARHGSGPATAVGALLGLLSAALRPFVVHPVQFVLDYPLAFGCLGIAGFWRWDSAWKAIGATVLANLARLACHVIAGTVYFTDSRLSLGGALGASLVYNLGHVLPETIICASLAVWLTRQQPALVRRQE